MAVEDVLGLLPAHVGAEPEPVGGPARVLVQLAGSPHVSDRGRHPGQVCGSGALLVRVGRGPDRDGLLEVVEPLSVTDPDLGHAERVQVPGPHGIEPELLGQP